MKKQRNKIITTLILLALLLSIAACGNKTFKCDICDKEKSGKSYKSQLMGEEIIICKDCYEDMKDFIGK